MSTKVWMSSLMSNSSVGMRQGLQSKFYGHAWNPASLIVPIPPDEVYAACKRQNEGHALKRHEFTEAVAVFDEKRFNAVRDIFTAGHFYAVKGRLIEVFSQIDMGEGGLVPFTIYDADKVTPKDIECYFLNFGSRKDTLVVQKCGLLQNLGNDKLTGRPLYVVNETNLEAQVVLSPAALNGADIWVEELGHNKLFMSDRLAQLLIKAKMKDVFRLTPCLIDGVDI